MEALGLASNIISFIELGFKIVSTARDYSGNTPISELAALVDELAPILDLPRDATTENELTALRRQAYDATKDTVEIAEKLYKSMHAPLWMRPVQRVRAARFTKQIHIKLEQISALRESILSIISRQRRDGVQQIQESPDFQELDAYGKATVTALLEQYLVSKNEIEAVRCFESTRRLMRHLQMSTGAENVQDLESPSTQAYTVKDERILAADRALLELLQYRVMDNREATITEAFESSYQSSLVRAAFFFWRNGTRLEKSEEGLWRSLLYSALNQQPQLMPIMFPREWALLYWSACEAWGEDSISESGLGAWQVRELKQAFRRLASQDAIPSKLFILIDGIDEYQNNERGDNYTTIIEFITDVSTSDNVKALISSRPLEAFDRSNLQPSLTLHELNHGDIERYVRDVFKQDSLFQTNRATDNEMAEVVINYILSEPQGVFLWAVLSARAVKSKLARGITLREIALNLSGELAPALGNLYRSIWEGMDNIAKAQASQILQIMLAGKEIKRSWLDNDEEALRLIDLALGLGNPNETINALITPWHSIQSKVKDRCNSIATGFMKTWPRFITIANPRKGERKWNPSLRIRCCHRGEPFNPGDSGDPHIHQDSDTGKYHDLLAELDRTIEHHHKILQQDIDKNYLPTVLQDHRRTVAISDRGRDSQYAHPHSWNDSFLSLAVQFGLQNYIKSQLSSESSSKALKIKKGRPLLHYALHPSLPPVMAEETLITPDVIQMLLAHGAHLNHKFEGRTCWEDALLWQYNTFAKREGRVASETGGTTEDIQRVAETRAEIFGILLEAHADVRATIMTEKGERIPAKESIP
ncbi:small s [Fusarium beomiforme]|uniref:Small s n=1 Tax=Fusarium beomiforme TaxID=44412 RepID=A0A9P5A5K6_9HYPO|nr:small s [Fusarium beomiforme]